MVKQWAPIYLNKNQKFEFTDELSNGKIPAIVLKKAFSLKTCKKITQKILNSNYITDGPGIDKKIGESLNSFLNQKETYFLENKCEYQLDILFLLYVFFVFFFFLGLFYFWLEVRNTREQIHGIHF